MNAKLGATTVGCPSVETTYLYHNTINEHFLVFSCRILVFSGHYVFSSLSVF